MKRGFTLIELLAVIVILAVIALIAVPAVLNVIEDSKRSSAERTADNYRKTIETTIVNEISKGNSVANKSYLVLEDGNICNDGTTSCSDDKKIKIDMDGNKPSSGRVTISNGKVVSMMELLINDYKVSYGSNSYETNDKTKTMLYGDLDLNGVVDSLDLMELKELSVTDNAYTYIGDLNCDGELTSADSALLSAYLAGNITSLPQCR